MNRKFFTKTISSLGMGATLLGGLAASANTLLTFQIDMTPAITNASPTFNPATQVVAARGTFDGWGTPGFVLTNNPNAANTNLYTGTYNDTDDANGGSTVWQYVIATGGTINTYETTADYNNRAALLPAISGASYTLPSVYWQDQGSAITNLVAFQVDMSMQIYLGNWNSASDTVGVQGNFNGWATALMTNNPLILRTNGQGVVTSNVYETILSVVNATNAANDFKYVVPQYNNQYENVSPANQDNGGNRWFINSSNQVLAPVFFGDQPFIPVDYVSVSNCMVTFTVQMTNAVADEYGITFDNSTNSSHTVWINGVYLGYNASWWTWASYPIAGGQSGYQMTQIPNTTLFTITLPVNMNQYENLVYKYSLDGYDDEAGSGDNHNRWIRSLPDYTMPVDTFGSQGGANVYEPSFGNLTITNLPSKKVQLSWLGRGGVELQTTSGLNPPLWVSQPSTDGTNLLIGTGGQATTNYNIGAGERFYRLTGPAQ